MRNGLIRAAMLLAATLIAACAATGPTAGHSSPGGQPPDRRTLRADTCTLKTLAIDVSEPSAHRNLRRPLCDHAGDPISRRSKIPG